MTQTRIYRRTSRGRMSVIIEKPEELSDKELAVLLHIEHEDGDETPPEGMSIAAYATACDGLKARGLAWPAFMEGHEVAAVRILPAGVSLLEDLREAEEKKKAEKKEAEEEGWNEPSPCLHGSCI